MLTRAACVTFNFEKNLRWRVSDLLSHNIKDRLLNMEETILRTLFRC